MTQKLMQLLQQKQWTIAAYESVTGGLFSHLLTNVPNASQVFLGSIVTYTNDIKVNVGHVPATIINQYGVVSKQTAEAMAIACQNQFNSDLAVSFTGNAGPGQLDHLPIGTVFATIVYHQQPTTYELSLNSTWPREKIKLIAVETIIGHLLQIILKSEKE
ncbi:CinA family protein [Spiroplasma sp. SV19]|uniref:CinA family protein n=1 Tax=Spiroplasma sp. SV19 TaxID=2570468 RepID=UPI0024B81387|nr:CinA family protein [Spiroplasma sp. SV19]WHQ36605.1 nicotinamide-nucleotide amidohydrolase family protein [Spiroplasma sp. SV19]